MNTEQQEQENEQSVKDFYAWCKIFPAVNREEIPESVLHGFYLTTMAIRKVEGLSDLSAEEGRHLIETFYDNIMNCFRVLEVVNGIADGNIVPISSAEFCGVSGLIFRNSLYSEEEGNGTPN